MNRILKRTPNLLLLKRQKSIVQLQSDPFGILKGIFATTGAVIFGHILLLKSTYTSYISEDHGRYLVLGSELNDDDQIEKRKKLVDTFLEIWTNGIAPFKSDIHPLAEHDLVSWLNLYRNHKPSFVKEFLLKTKENHQRALKSLSQLEKILSEDATIYEVFWSSFIWMGISVEWNSILFQFA